MTDGLLNQNRALSSYISNQEASGAHPVTPQGPFVPGYPFRSIGKEPELLRRMQNASPGENAGGSYHCSPSPSQEELASESPPDDNNARHGSLSRRTRLIEAFGADVNMDDMYVDVNDVNLPVGVSLGPRETQTTSFAVPTLASRLQLRPTSNGQLNTTANHSATMSSSMLNDVQQDRSCSLPKTKSNGITSSPFPTQNHPVPPTPPPENDPSPQSSGPNTDLPYESLQTLRLRLQSLTEIDATNSDDFNEIRELAQTAKVESTSISLATQKAASLAQKALASAQESMQASQECVEISRGAKKRWEAATQGCERFIKERSMKKQQQQDAIKKELAALGDSIKVLEEDYRRRTEQAKREEMERKQARQIAARALNHPTDGLSSSALPTPAPASSQQPAAPVSEENNPTSSVYMLALAQQVNDTNKEFERLKKEVHELRKMANDRNAGHLKGTQEHGKEPKRTAAQSTDPNLLEQALRNKLKSQKNKSNNNISSSSSSVSSMDLSNGSQIRNSTLSNDKSKHDRAASGASQINHERTSIPGADPVIKAEIEDQKLAAHPPTANPPGPNPQPASSQKSASSKQGDSVQLEYLPMSKSSMDPKATPSRHVRPRGYAPPQLSLAYSSNVVRSTVKPHSTCPARESEDSEESPVHLNRQGSDPGNLPIFLPENDNLRVSLHSTSQDSEGQLHPMINEPIKEEPTESRVHFPQAVRRIAPDPMATVSHPPIATLLEASSVDSNSSTFSSAPAFPIPPPLHARGRSRNRKYGRGQQQQQPQLPDSGSNLVAPPPASTHLPQRPVVSVPDTHPHVVHQVKATQNVVGGCSQPNSVNSNGNYRVMDVAEAISQQSIRVPPGSRVGSGEFRRASHIMGSRPPLADRSYRPARLLSRSRSRSRSPIRRPRDQPHRDYDHYSPSRNGPIAGRRRSSMRQYPPARSPPRRVINPRRRSPGFPLAPPLLAGSKRPLENPVGSQPLPVRRRVEEPPIVHSPPPVPALPAPPVQRVGGPKSRAGEKWTEEWSRTAEHHPSPPSSSGMSLGFQFSPTNVSQQQRQDDDGGPAKLASRLSDAHYLNGSNGPSAPPQSQRNNGTNGGASHPPPSWNPRDPEESSESSRPGLLDRFSGPASTDPRGAPRDARAARGRGSGRGRGGHTQTLNDRISFGSSLLQRIQDS